MLIPPVGDILDTLSQNSNHSELVDLLKKAGIAEDMQREGPYTFFAPTNQVYKHLSLEPSIQAICFLSSERFFSFLSGMRSSILIPVYLQQ